LILAVDEGIEADENVEGLDKLKDDSSLHDSAEGEHDSDSMHHEHQDDGDLDDGDLMFEADSEIPLLQDVSSIIVLFNRDVVTQVFLDDLYAFPVLIKKMKTEPADFE
jgi:hypothetical protein